MKIIETKLLSASQKESIHYLWNNEYPEPIIHASMTELDRYLNGLENPHHLFLSDQQQKITGWGFSFERNSELWFAIIVDRNEQGKGYGKELLTALKKQHSVLNGWVIDHDTDKRKDGTPYPSPLSFYLANGFKVNQETRLETERISAVRIEWRDSF